MATRTPSGMLSEYSHLRTVPALIGIIYTVASAYQFGALNEVHLAWFDYTLTTQHAMFASLGAYAVAFASSDTKQFENYEQWEQLLIGIAPVILVAHQYSAYVGDLFVNNDPVAGMVAFVVVVIGWGVAVR